MKCLIVQPIHQAGIDLLNQNGVETVLCPTADMSEVAAQIAGFDAVITRNAGLSGQVICAADKLKLIAVHGSGYDRVDVAAASPKNIYVCTIPGVNARSVCELALGLMLALARRITQADKYVRAGQAGFREQEHFFELFGKTVLIIGWGAIGRALGTLLKSAFNMRVLVYSPNVSDISGFERVEGLEEGLSQADIISLHTPLRPQTHNLLNKQTFAHIKPGAILINTARAGLIDETALLEALEEKRLRAAALDVYSPAAPLGKLGMMEQVIFTPHLGGSTDEALQRSALAVAQLVLQLKNGQIPDNVVNPTIK